MTLDDLERFHADFRAALLAQVPLEIDSDGGRLTSARLEHLCDELRKKLSPAPAPNSLPPNSPSVINSIESIESVPPRFKAAFQTYARVGSMPTILECLACRPIASQQVNQALRPMWVYLAALILIAFGGLCLFAAAVEPTIASLRADASLIASDNNLNQSDFVSSLKSFLPVIGLLLIALFAWALLGGFRKLSTWLGGAAYVRHRLTNAALDSIELLVASGLPTKEAIPLGCLLANVDNTTQQEIMSLSSTDIDYSVDRMNYLNLLADRRLKHIRDQIPVTTISIVGGFICACYGVLVFRPIIALLVDIGRVTT